MFWLFAIWIEFAGLLASQGWLCINTVDQQVNKIIVSRVYCSILRVCMLTYILSVLHERKAKQNKTKQYMLLKFYWSVNCVYLVFRSSHFQVNKCGLGLVFSQKCLPWKQIMMYCLRRVGLWWREVAEVGLCLFLVSSYITSL